MVTVIDDLRMAREAAGLSHNDVSRRMGHGGTRGAGSLICKWERGQTMPSLASLESWATVLGRAITTEPAGGAGLERPVCVLCGATVHGRIRRKYCTEVCMQEAARLRRQEQRATRKATPEPDPLVAAAIRAIHSLYGMNADEVVHALDLTDPAAVGYARRVCEGVRHVA